MSSLPWSQELDTVGAEVASTSTEHRVGYQVGKRLLDLTVSAVVLLVLAPLLLVLAIAIRITSPGPVLFTQRRVGRDGREFVMLKLRSMRTGCSDELHRAFVTEMLTAPEGTGTGLQKLADDPRITPLGKVLRKTSLDELPQLVNVLRGQMSLVGPRPVLPWEAELLRGEFGRRFTVPPGVTGLWQTSGRSALSMRQALELDCEYVDRRSFALDLVILLKTAVVVLRHRDAA